jgi:hypothetical protein
MCKCNTYTFVFDILLCWSQLWPNVMSCRPLCTRACRLSEVLPQPEYNPHMSLGRMRASATPPAAAAGRLSSSKSGHGGGRTRDGSSSSSSSQKQGGGFSSNMKAAVAAALLPAGAAWRVERLCLMERETGSVFQSSREGPTSTGANHFVVRRILELPGSDQPVTAADLLEALQVR